MEKIGTGLIGGAVLFITGTFFWLAWSSFLTFNSVRAPGRVIQLVRRQHLGFVFYCPVFVFRDSDGVEHVVRSGIGGNPPHYPIGRRVSVLYLPSNPKRAQIEDRVILWEAPLALMVLSFIYGAAGFVIRRKARIA